MPEKEVIFRGSVNDFNGEILKQTEGNLKQGDKFVIVYKK